MTDYEKLLDKAASRKIKVREVPMILHDGLTNGKVICIRSTIPTEAEKADVLAEEIAHTELTVGDILDQSVTENRKQERKARLRAYDMRIGLNGIVRAFQAGCKSISEFSEYLHTGESFFIEAVECYRNVYGESVLINGFRIQFDPNFDVFRIE